jgi:RimJ/RimL family protein N-acetyltransferase
MPVTLRPVADADADDLFRMMRDPEAVHMAAFTPDDPDDRARFDAHLARIRTDPEITMRAVVRDGRLAGSIAGFPLEGHNEITYWIDRPLWGRGVATEALTLFLRVFETRPLRARAASDNAASRRVLEKAGFKAIGTDVGYASARRAEIEETIYVLD